MGSESPSGARLLLVGTALVLAAAALSWAWRDLCFPLRDPADSMVEIGNLSPLKTGVSASLDTVGKITVLRVEHAPGPQP